MRAVFSSVIAYLIANGAGLLLAILMIDGFSVAFMAFLVAVFSFCVVQALATPLATKVSRDYAPQLLGGISLICVFLGLLATDVFVPGTTIGGLTNLLAATLLVWLGSLIAQVVLKHFGYGNHG